MKKKGFTLIELLAVIVILSVITLITIPMITNVIEESKKKALASSIQGLVESANLYAIEKDGVYEFLFDKEHQGSTKKGEQLDYRGTIDGEGKLYLDKEGNVSVCISNDTYYAYKNYNSGIIVGDKKTGNCIIGFDALTNKYVAMLDNGTGNVSNVYSKDEVNNLVDSLDNKITNMKSNIEELQNNLNNYALQSELDKTNTNIESLSSLVSNNQTNIDSMILKDGNYTSDCVMSSSGLYDYLISSMIPFYHADQYDIEIVSAIYSDEASGDWKSVSGLNIESKNQLGFSTVVRNKEYAGKTVRVSFTAKRK